MAVRPLATCRQQKRRHKSRIQDPIDAAIRPDWLDYITSTFIHYQNNCYTYLHIDWSVHEESGPGLLGGRRRRRRRRRCDSRARPGNKYRAPQSQSDRPVGPFQTITVTRFQSTAALEATALLVVLCYRCLFLLAALHVESAACPNYVMEVTTTTIANLPIIITIIINIDIVIIKIMIILNLYF